ncbi:hypothetical protein C8Q79DRAFT_572561 [Trametes meyenii]|nr:hypothetical protein C8Q79DRAFT_572561 [Trametes meyenii]
MRCIDHTQASSSGRQLRSHASPPPPKRPWLYYLMPLQMAPPCPDAPLRPCTPWYRKSRGPSSGKPRRNVPHVYVRWGIPTFRPISLPFWWPHGVWFLL